MTDPKNLTAPTVSLEEVIKAMVSAGIARVHTSLPASVVSYNPALQTISAQISVMGTYTDDSGITIPYAFPVLSNVPVVWPQATGFSLTFPLTAGDPVELVFNERSTDEWRSTGAAINQAQDVRRFDLSDAYAIPGGRGFVPAAGVGLGAVLQGNPVQLGSSAAVDFVALSSLVATELQRLWTAIQTHTHTGVTIGAGATGTTVYPGVPASVACTTTKAL